MCGASGYNLLREKFPLPSIRTLQRQTTGPSKCNEENQRDILANLPSNAQHLEENDQLE
jgi:hypothetical protein